MVMQCSLIKGTSRIFSLFLLSFCLFILSPFSPLLLPWDYKSEETFSSNSLMAQESTITICPAIPPNLEGKLNISSNVSLEEAEAIFSEKVILGGSYEPRSCRSRWKIAIIIPFRNRDMHLGPFHHHMHKFLQKQQLTYTIFIVNQTDDRPFNRAKLFNVGFDEVRKIDQFDCFIFHDVDFLPDNDHNLYHCTTMPRRMVVSYNKHPYRNEEDFNKNYLGGVVMLTEEHMKQINGFSNKYWGWGCEDDDLKIRIEMNQLQIWRSHRNIGTYQMLHQADAEKNPERAFAEEGRTGADAMKIPFKVDKSSVATSGDLIRKFRRVGTR